MKITIEISSLDELMRLKQWLNTVNNPTKMAVKSSQQILSPVPRTDVSQPIDMLGLMSRTNICLRAEGINTLGDLLELTDIDLLNMPNLGKKSLVDIKDALHLRGLDLKKGTAG